MGSKNTICINKKPLLSLIIQNVFSECDLEETQLMELLNKIGLSEAKAKETQKNSNLTSNLVAVINAALEKCDDVDGTKGSLIYNAASKIKPQINDHLPMLGHYIALNKIDSEVRLNAAIGKFSPYIGFSY